MRIDKTTLMNSGEYEFGDFNVFIGGNGVGKTTFLLELHSKSAGIPRKKYFWIAKPEYNSGDLRADLQLLKSSMSRRYEGANLFFFSQAAKNVSGDVDLSNDLRFTSQERNTLDDPQELSVFDNMKYRRPFIALCSADARLGLPDSVEISGLDQPPQDPISVLYRNPRMLEQIDQTIRDRFEFNFILLNHTQRRLDLGVSKEIPPQFVQDVTNLQDEYEKIERWKEEQFTTMSESGHGIRSMIRLLTSIFEPVNKVIMIDEPEIHLYPSQKRWLGKQLVELAKTQKKQVFLVTHDPMVLQGILDASAMTNIFRIERDKDNKGTIRSCELKQISDVTAIRNQEQYLQGLFYQRCIVVEGASDRSFYQNMTDDYPSVTDKDLGFVACGGKGSSKHMAILASKVGLKCSFIYDFDVILYQTEIIKDIYKLLGGQDNPLGEVEKLFEGNDPICNAKDDKEKNRAIKELTGYREKEGLTSLWSHENHAVFVEAIENLTKVGIFVVPKGSLESWAPDVEPKIRFAELAPETIREDQTLKSRLDEFLVKVLSHLGI